MTGASSCANGVCDTSSGTPGVCGEPPPLCGNSVLEAGEGCDDGGLDPGDGCDAACLVEDGIACNAATPGSMGASSCSTGVCDISGGAPGVCGAPAPVCGNGNLESAEGCDDGNVASGDGCDAGCQLETGFACTNTAIVGRPTFVSTNAADRSDGFTNPANTVDGLINQVNTGNNGFTFNSTAATGVPNPVFNYSLTVNPGETFSIFELYGTVGAGTSEQLTMYRLTLSIGGTLVFSNTATTGALLPNGSPLLLSGFVLTAGTYQIELEDLDAPRLDREFSEIQFTGNSASNCVFVLDCGNGAPNAGEECDDGNIEVGDGCDDLCQIEPAAPECGNGILEPGEFCDDGNVVPGDLCDENCMIQTAFPGCGDGVLVAGEGCDDGNTIDLDVCNNSCLIRTGNPCNDELPGFLDGASCESGICDSTGGAPGFCQPEPACGDGNLDAGEGCDDLNAIDGDGCDSTCLIEEGGACNELDPGNIGADSCQSGVCDTSGGVSGVCASPLPGCGDGSVDAGEECDDGNTVNGDGCDANCTIETADPLCGNSDLDVDEGCDDGNLISGDGCNEFCLIEDGGTCVTDNVCASGICEDDGTCGFINSGEPDDSVNLEGGGCSHVGFGAGGFGSLLFMLFGVAGLKRRRRED